MEQLETIIVCISNPAHAESLIVRGATLARAFPGGRCLVLNVHPRPYDALQFAELQAMQMFRTLSEKYGLPLIERHSGTRPTAEVIAEVVQEESVTQIVIGQSPQHRLQSLLHDTLINQLLKLHTGADLHIVEVNPLPLSESPALDRGMRAWVSRDSAGKLRMYHEQHEHFLAKGIFFKRSATDFEHGYFVPWPGECMHVFEVIDGCIAEKDAPRLESSCPQ